MHRRDFLRLLLATPIAMQLDVEKLLWVPGEKKIFIPEVPISLYGIPYHMSYAEVGIWMGFSRKQFYRIEEVKGY